MERVGFYPGSFDPVTNGHLDLIRRAGSLVDRLVIGVGTHGSKQAYLTADERVMLISEMLRTEFPAQTCRFEVVSFSDLTIEAAQRAGAQFILRGLRDGVDFDYEVQMAHMNLRLAPKIETVFLAAHPETRMISSSLVKQIEKMGGDVSGFLPNVVCRYLQSLREKSSSH